MPVEITFHANDPIALLDQVRAFCGQLNNNGTSPMPYYADPRPAAVVAFDNETYQDGFDEGALAIGKKTKEAKEKKPRKVKTKDAALPEEPPQTEEPIDDDEIEAPEQEVEATAVKTAHANGDAAKALIKLKDDTIAILQQAFADGKVAKLRALLDTYGDGAKSFPEIEAAKFDAIAQAVEKGALR